MTSEQIGRTCPIHGEWCADGVCRWCEAQTPPEPRKVHPDVPKGSTLCRCGEYAWAPWCPSNEREGVIAGVAHSPEQCFKLDAEPPSSPTMYETTFTPTEKTAEAFVWRLEWTESVITAGMNAEEERWRLHQHAALRWERVARRWATKHGPWTLRDVAHHWQSLWNKLVDCHMEILKRNNPLLFEKPKEPKR